MQQLLREKKRDLEERENRVLQKRGLFLLGKNQIFFSETSLWVVQVVGVLLIVESPLTPPVNVGKFAEPRKSRVFIVF